MRKDQKPYSWLPLTAAIVIPVVLIVVAILASRFMTGEESPGDEAAITQAGQAYLVIKLEDKEGAPVGGRTITFEHVRTLPEETTPTMIRKETDTAGMATVTLVKDGNVIVRVEGEEEEEVLPLEGMARDSFEMTLVVEE